VQALVTSAPYISPRASGLLESTQHLVAELPLPLFLYNMPMMTRQFATDTAARLLDQKNIRGQRQLKDFGYFEQLGVGAATIGWSVLIGPEHLLVDV
jgi:4-hydroxy-tetrahydrodipicolinate synthase